MVVIVKMGLIVLCIMIIGCRKDNNSNEPPKEAAQEQTMEQKFGIHVEKIQLSAAGRMLDFRYRVIDPNRAHLVLSRKSQIFLIDKASGAKLMVPTSTKIGSLRQMTRKPESGRIYFVMFANPGGFVKRGNKVSITIGEFTIDELIVQ